jgi:uncharacterized membrane protein YeaQ/YmgE (transglycosylase-associated protein family)
MFWLLQYAIFGLIAGALARLIHPGKDPMNWLFTMLLGIGGSLLGGWIGGFVGINVDEGIMRWVAAVAGAVLLLVMYYFLTTRSTPQGRVATNDEYKKAVFNDLSRGPNG